MSATAGASATIARSRLAFDRSGSGPPLVLLHPLGADRRVWGVVPRLAGERELIAVDLPGFGGSPPPRGRADPARDLIRAYAHAPGFPEVNAAMRANTFSRLAEIRVPVTLAWPEHDRMVARLRHPPGNVRTVVLPGAGHLPMWDEPQQIAELLLNA